MSTIEELQKQINNINSNLDRIIAVINSNREHVAGLEKVIVARFQPLESKTTNLGFDEPSDHYVSTVSRICEQLFPWPPNFPLDSKDIGECNNNP